MYEQNSYVGGRNGSIKIDGFTFDIGPTFLMLTDVLEEIFSFVGKNIHEYLQLKEIEPLYRLRFNGKVDFYPSRDKAYMLKQISDLFPGDEIGYQKFLDEEEIKFKKVFKCLRIPYDNLVHFARPTFLKALPKLDLGKNLYGQLAKYFKHNEGGFDDFSNILVCHNGCLIAFTICLILNIAGNISSNRWLKQISSYGQNYKEKVENKFI